MSGLPAHVTITATRGPGRLARLRYYFRDCLRGSDRECSRLFPDLFSALRACIAPMGIKPVPTAWGAEAPLADFGGRYPWIVEETHTYSDGKKSRAFVANFEDPSDAFIFAEAKGKAAGRGPHGSRWCVLLFWPNEAGRHREIERFHAGWLREQRRAHDAQERRQRNAA